MKILVDKWYIIVTLLSAFWLAGEFYDYFPREIAFASIPEKVVTPESDLLSKFKQRREDRNLWTEEVQLNLNSPFHASPQVKKSGSKKIKNPPLRNLKLKGIAGEETAIMLNNAGERQFVNVNDVIDSAKVLKITPSKVRLRDRSGTFEIFLDQ